MEPAEWARRLWSGGVGYGGDRRLRESPYDESRLRPYAPSPAGCSRQRSVRNAAKPSTERLTAARSGQGRVYVGSSAGRRRTTPAAEVTPASVVGSGVAAPGRGPREDAFTELLLKSTTQGQLHDDVGTCCPCTLHWFLQARESTPSYITSSLAGRFLGGRHERKDGTEFWMRTGEF
ncbi:unnamed protein product [Lampetra planeri]